MRTLILVTLSLLALANTAWGADEQPIIHSKTMISIVPKGTIPKPITIRDDSSAPDMNALPASVKDQEAAEAAQAEEAVDEAKSADGSDDKPDEEVVYDKNAPQEEAVEPLAPPAPLVKLEVQVRHHQLPLDNGMYMKYVLDDKHGVLTYFSTAEERNLAAENIYEPIDILFLRDDGVIAQIMPEVMLAYLSEEVIVEFPVRAFLYVQAGLSQAWGIRPGDRVDHGMFTPKPVIQKE